MNNVTGRQFGLLIAYVIPGAIALWGVSLVSEPVRVWLLGTKDSGPTMAGACYLFVAALAAGLTASTVRWALIDSLHARTGLSRPPWDDEKLVERLEAYELLIGIHYRYYQFYANSLVAMLFSFSVYAVQSNVILDWRAAGLLAIAIVFYAASRDALSNYYRRTSILLGIQKGSGAVMTNGGHHDGAGAHVSGKNTGQKPTESPSAKSAKSGQGPVAGTQQGQGPSPSKR